MEDKHLKFYAINNNWVELLANAQEQNYSLSNLLPLVYEMTDEALRQHILLSLQRGKEALRTLQHILFFSSFSSSCSSLTSTLPPST